MVDYNALRGCIPGVRVAIGDKKCRCGSIAGKEDGRIDRIAGYVDLARSYNGVGCGVGTCRKYQKSYGYDEEQEHPERWTGEYSIPCSRMRRSVVCCQIPDTRVFPKLCHSNHLLFLKFVVKFFTT